MFSINVSLSMGLVVLIDCWLRLLVETSDISLVLDPVDSSSSYVLPLVFIGETSKAIAMVRLYSVHICLHSVAELANMSMSEGCQLNQDLQLFSVM